MIATSSTRRPFADRARVATLAALVALAVLNGADVVTTHLILARGAVEADPLSALLLNSGKLLVAKLLLVGYLGYRVISRPGRLGVMATTWFAAGIYATAVLSNLLILRLEMGR